MKILTKSNGVFPMQIKCQRVVDEYGYAYGKENDFCGSELEIEAKDIKKHKWSKFYDTGTDYGVVCPVCGQFIDINEDKIPRNVLENAEEIHLS